MTTHRHKASKAGKLVVLALLLILAVGIIFAIAWLYGNRTNNPKHEKSNNQSQNKSEPEVKQPPKPELINIQAQVDTWLVSQPGDFGLLVYDPDNEQVIGQHQTDLTFFTASIYKLYVVYLALEDVDSGLKTLDQDFKFGKTRQQCIHDAIHTSDSPCAEALLAEIGQETANNRLTKLGLTNNTFPSFTTNASDAAALVKRLQSGSDLSKNSTDILLEAMKTQVYRNGLPKGMSQATVFDKVGFSETPHYHDVGIVELPSGRQYIVVFLSKGTGSKQANSFGQLVFDSLNK